jgi:type VII secretion integral membrane protein EccD
MNAPASPARLAAGGATELCHLTVSGPGRRADLAIPATATLGELLPIVVKHTAGDGAADGAWVLQRLGGPPLDFGGTAESLDLREGEVLYLTPEAAPLPEFDFDDVSVGVAHSVAARSDQWRPSFSRTLMTGAAAVVAGAFAVGLAGVRPTSTQVLCYGLATLLLAVGAVLDSRLAEEKALATTAGLGACAFAALLGFAARHGASGLFTVDRRALMIVGFAVAAVALLVVSVGRLSVAVFGAVTGTALCAALGAALANAFQATAVTIVAILAAVLYAATSVNLRIALRVARLRVALLPRTAEELQQDIDPVPEAEVTAKTGRAVAQLNALFVTCSLVYVTAFAQLATQHGWVGKTLAGVFATTVLLRARALTLAWQRAPLALAGTAGLCLVAVTVARNLSSAGHVWTLLLLLAAAVALLVAARRLPGRRLLPIWGQLADTAELWTSIALIPLLLQLLHVYARFRALIS